MSVTVTFDAEVLLGAYRLSCERWAARGEVTEGGEFPTVVLACIDGDLFAAMPDRLPLPDDRNRLAATLDMLAMAHGHDCEWVVHNGDSLEKSVAPEEVDLFTHGTLQLLRELGDPDVVDVLTVTAVTRDGEGFIASQRYTWEDGAPVFGDVRTVPLDADERIDEAAFVVQALRAVFV